MEVTLIADPLTDLRYALEVMEANSHLGLEDEFAGKLRSILVRRIREAEKTQAGHLAAPVRFPIVAEKVPA